MSRPFKSVMAPPASVMTTLAAAKSQTFSTYLGDGRSAVRRASGTKGNGSSFERERREGAPLGRQAAEEFGLAVGDERGLGLGVEAKRVVDDAERLGGGRRRVVIGMRSRDSSHISLAPPKPDSLAGARGFFAAKLQASKPTSMLATYARRSRRLLAL